MATTPRWGLHYPVGTDAPDVPLWMSELATDLDGVAMDDQGTLANRPTSTVQSPGKKGRYYFATDDTTGGPNGTLYRDTGTAWIQVSGFIPNGSVSSSAAKLTAGTVGQSSDLSLTAANANAYADVPGLTYAVHNTYAALLRVTVTARLTFTVQGSAGDAAVSLALLLNGTAQPVTPTAVANTFGDNRHDSFDAPVTQTWDVPIGAMPVDSPAVKNTVKVQAMLGSPMNLVGNAGVTAGTLSYLLLAT